MITSLDLSGLDRLRARFEKIANPDATPLMKHWMDIISNDNRKGVLAGLDCKGNPMESVKYRPVGPPKKPTSAQRGGRNPRALAGAFQGGVGGNLTSGEYRHLGGPPLAPRGQFSRVITNLKTTFQDGRKTKPWMAWGVWDNVVSRKGVAFLKYHFDGAKLKRGGELPSRDLRGVRPEGLELARMAMRNWIIDVIRSAP